MITINPVKLKAIKNEQARIERARAFSKEYDPLVGQHIRGEITMEELTAKAQEIRDRYPYEE